MGTSKSINPGIPNDPFWQQIGRDLDSLCIELPSGNNKNNDDATEDEEIDQHLKRNIPQLSPIRNDKVSKLFSDLIQANGGRVKISSGRSKSFGRAGRKTLKNTFDFITSVRDNGLSTTLSEYNINQAHATNTNELISILQSELCSRNSTSQDNTAASSALEMTLKEILANYDFTEIPLGTFAELYFQNYIFEYFNQLYYKRYSDKNISTDNIYGLIRAYVDNKLDLSIINKFVNGIDSDGKQKFCDNVFEYVLNVFEL